MMSDRCTFTMDERGVKMSPHHQRQRNPSSLLRRAEAAATMPYCLQGCKAKGQPRCVSTHIRVYVRTCRPASALHRYGSMVGIFHDPRPTMARYRYGTLVLRLSRFFLSGARVLERHPCRSSTYYSPPAPRRRHHH